MDVGMRGVVVGMVICFLVGSARGWELPDAYHTVRKGDKGVEFSHYSTPGAERVATNVYHIVKRGDTVLGIARRIGLTWNQLCELNRKTEGWELIRVGEWIRVKGEIDRSRCFERPLQPDTTVDIVEFIIKGDAVAASKLCEYPVGVCPRPLAPEIEDEKAFIKWFPVIFDTDVRKRLETARAEGNGWRDYAPGNAEEFFHSGDLFRNYYTKKLNAITVISAPLLRWWQAAYRRDLATLAPKYRSGCGWPLYYLVSEDWAYFARVDSLDEPWTLHNAGDRSGNKYRVMLFRRGQNTSDNPYRIFNYNASDEHTHWGNRPSCEGFESELNDFEFSATYTTQVPGEFLLTFDSRSGNGTTLYLNPCDWPPPNAANSLLLRETAVRRPKSGVR